MAELSGVTYFSREEIYDGDVTKGCSLKSKEIDDNFYFLRGNDVKDIRWNEDGKTVTIIKYNGGTITTDSIDPYITGLINSKVSGITNDIIQINTDIEILNESIGSAYGYITPIITITGDDVE